MVKKILMNSLMLFLSVFMALLLWLYVNNEEDPIVSKSFSDIPVRIINESSFTKLGYTFTIIEGQYVNITATGRSSLLSKCSSEDFEAFVDFEQLSKVYAVPIMVSSDYDDQLEINIKGSGMMQIQAETMEETQLPVEISTKGKPDKDYIYNDNGKVMPNMITINAPKSIIDKAEKFVVTVNINGASSSINTTKQPVLYDKNGKKIESNQITTDASDIQVKLPILKTKSVPVKLHKKGKVKNGYKLKSFAYSPETIKIAGEEDVIKQIHSIDLGEVDIDKRKKTYETEFPINETMLPDGIIMAQDTKIKIQCKIVKK